MKRKLTLVANWKAHPETPQKARTLFRSIKTGIPKKQGISVVVCAPSIYLEGLSSLSRSAKLRVGAQNISTYDGGAHTGEVSVRMLKESGVGITIVGHSERRAEGETDKEVNTKIKMALKYNMDVILCVGELTRNEDGTHFSYVKNQLEKALKGVPKGKVGNIFVAYEPVWAISGKGKHADSPESFVEMSIFIRKVLNGLYGKTTAMKTQVIYGGSVNERNAENFLMHKETQGFLIGKASLDAVSFKKIMHLAEAFK